MKMSDMMGEADKLRAAITTWDPSKEAVERAALVNERREALAAAKRERFRLSRGAIEDIARAALIAGHEDAPSDLAASECAPSGEPSEEAINKSFEFLNMRLCEFGDKAEMRNLLRAAYAIDAIRARKGEASNGNVG